MELVALANMFYIIGLIILLAMIGSAVGLAAWVVICYIVHFFSKGKRGKNGRKK